MQFPLILALNHTGTPMNWITYEDCATYYAKNKILWSMGSHEIVLHGGTNAATGKQSVLTMDTIVAISSEEKGSKFKKTHPSLTNKTLFKRDWNICAYCGNKFLDHQLTRDHVIPTSKGGRNTWQNVVTACEGCNKYKGAKTPEEAQMELLYVPYVASFSEHLILSNRKLLADQMEYLIKQVPAESRIHSNMN